DPGPRGEVPRHGEGDRRGDLAGGGGPTQGGRRPGDRRGRTRGHLVLRGRTLPGAEGGVEPEGTPGGYVLELGHPDAGVDHARRRGPPADRDRRHPERPRRREGDRPWGDDGRD